MTAAGNAAHLLDLERRIRELEATSGLPSLPEYDRDDAVSLYLCACKPQIPTEESAQLWAAAAHGLTARTLLLLAGDVRDPFPWKPFLHVLDACSAAGFKTQKAAVRLVAVAQDLLALQGLGPLVTVADVMGAPLQVHRASAAISLCEEANHGNGVRSTEHQEARGS